MERGELRLAPFFVVGTQTLSGTLSAGLDDVPRTGYERFVGSPREPGANGVFHGYCLNAHRPGVVVERARERRGTAVSAAAFDPVVVTLGPTRGPDRDRRPQ